MNDSHPRAPAAPLQFDSLDDSPPADQLIDMLLFQADQDGIERERILMMIWLRDTENKLLGLRLGLQLEFIARLMARFFVGSEGEA